MKNNLLVSEKYLQIILSLKKEGVLIVKNGKNPNFEQKRILVENGYDWNDWLTIKDKGTSYEFRKKSKDSDNGKPETIVLDKKSR